MSLPMAPRGLALRIVAGATFLLAANGCVDQKDAANLSKLSDEARVSLPRVSNDVAGTCARQNTLFENTPQAERPAAEQARTASRIRRSQTTSQKTRTSSQTTSTPSASSPPISL